MPRVALVFYRDKRGVPVVDWLRVLRERDKLAYARCVARLRQLAELGQALRRPAADYLQNGIYELRVRKGRVNFRIFYFFHARNVAVLAHAMTKEDRIPLADMRRAIERKRLFSQNPDLHSYEEDV